MWQQVTYPTRCQDRLACWKVLLKEGIVCVVHMNKVTFDGDGSIQSVVGMGFSLDLLEGFFVCFGELSPCSISQIGSYW